MHKVHNDNVILLIWKCMCFVSRFVHSLLSILVDNDSACCIFVIAILVSSIHHNVMRFVDTSCMAHPAGCIKKDMVHES